MREILAQYKFARNFEPAIPTAPAEAGDAPPGAAGAATGGPTDPPGARSGGPTGDPTGGPPGAAGAAPGGPEGAPADRPGARSGGPAGARQGARGASLGTNTEKAAKITPKNARKTVEYQPPADFVGCTESCTDRERYSAKLEARAERYRLQTVVTKILASDKNPDGGPWRVGGCLRRGAGSYVEDGIGILLSEEYQRARFSNLTVCGSVWTCPPCAALISSRRAKELEAATQLHQGAGGQCLMITMTWAHSLNERLQPMMAAARKAGRAMRKHRRYVEMLATLGHVGHVRCLEVKHGSHGWHPHYHELHFVAQPLSDRQTRALHKTIYELWADLCSRFGLGRPNRKHGVDIRVAISAAEYLSKFGVEQRWGIHKEILFANGKTRGKSVGPWEILALYERQPAYYGALFREYAAAFYRHQQLRWSHGLKAAMQIEDLTDEEIANMPESDARLICSIPMQQWRMILRQRYEARPVLLRLAETGGAEAVNYFLNQLMHSEERGM